MSATHFRNSGQARLIRGCFSSSQCFRAGVFSSLSPPPTPLLLTRPIFSPLFEFQYVLSRAKHSRARRKRLHCRQIKYSRALIWVVMPRFTRWAFKPIALIFLELLVNNFKKLFTRSSRNIKAPRYRRRLFSIIFLQFFIRLNRVLNQNRKTVWANPLKVRKAVSYPLVF